MPRDLAGVYSLPSGYKATPGTTILDTQHNPPLEDIAQALTDSMPRSGAAGFTGLFTLYGDATAALQPVTYQQLQATQKLNKGASAPSSPQAGWLWLEDDNPSSTVWTLRLFDGTDWVSLGTLDTTANLFTAPATATVPAKVAGEVIQVQTYTDAGSSTTSTSMVNANGGNFSFTPKSTSSKLVITASALCQEGGLAATNTIGTIEIRESGVLIGNSYTFSAAGVTDGISTTVPVTLQVTLANAALTARTFSFYHRTSNGSAAVSTTKIAWTIMEVAA